MLYKVVLAFESVDEILKCDHSNESYLEVLSCAAVYYSVLVGSNFCKLVGSNFCRPRAVVLLSSELGSRALYYPKEK